MRHLVNGQRQKAPNFSAFHWSPHGCLITIGQHFVTTRVVHLPKRTETSLITESDQSRANHQLLQLCTVRTAWSDSDQAVRAVHSCKSWFLNRASNYPRWHMALLGRRANVDSTSRPWISFHSVLVRCRVPAGCVCFIGEEIYFHSYYMLRFSIKQMLHTICCTMILYVETAGRVLFNVVIPFVQSRCVNTIKYV